MSARIKEGYTPLDYYKKGPKILDFTDDGVNCIIGLNMTEEELAEILKEREEKGITETLSIIRVEEDPRQLEIHDYVTSVYLTSEQKYKLNELGIKPSRVIDGEISIEQMNRIFNGEDINKVLNETKEEENNEEVKEVEDEVKNTDSGNSNVNLSEEVKLEEPKKVKKLFKRRNVVVEDEVKNTDSRHNCVNLSEEVKEEKATGDILESMKNTVNELMNNEVVEVEEELKENDSRHNCVNLSEDSEGENHLHDKRNMIMSEEDSFNSFFSMCNSGDKDKDELIDKLFSMSDEEFLKQSSDYVEEENESDSSIVNLSEKDNSEETNSRHNCVNLLEEDEEENGDLNYSLEDFGIKMFKDEYGEMQIEDTNDYSEYEVDEDEVQIMDQEDDEEDKVKYEVVYFGTYNKKELSSWQRLMLKSFPNRYRLGEDPRERNEKARKKREARIKKKKDKYKGMTPEQIAAIKEEKERKRYLKEYNKFKKNIIMDDDKKRYKKFVKEQEKINASYEKYLRDTDPKKECKDIIEYTRQIQIEDMHKRLGWKEFFNKKKHWWKNDPYRRYRQHGNIITVSEATAYKKDFCNTFMKNLEQEIMEKINAPVNFGGDTIVEYYDKHGRLKSKEILKNDRKKNKKQKKKYKKQLKKTKKAFREYNEPLLW